jgi:hypothetical protein
MVRVYIKKPPKTPIKVYRGKSSKSALNFKSKLKIIQVNLLRSHLEAALKVRSAVYDIYLQNSVIKFINNHKCLSHYCKNGCNVKAHKKALCTIEDVHAAYTFIQQSPIQLANQEMERKQIALVKKKENKTLRVAAIERCRLTQEKIIAEEEEMQSKLESVIKQGKSWIRKVLFIIFININFFFFTVIIM